MVTKNDILEFAQKVSALETEKKKIEKEIKDNKVKIENYFKQPTTRNTTIQNDKLKINLVSYEKEKQSFVLTEEAKDEIKVLKKGIETTLKKIDEIKKPFLKIETKQIEYVKIHKL